jgi:hypothetical protein
MFNLPEIELHRLISLSWVTGKGDGISVVVCAVENLEQERLFREEFDKQGLLYHRVLESVGIDLNDADYVRLTSTTLPYVII